MYKVITPTEEAAVSLSEFKTQLNMEGYEDENTYLQLLLNSSTNYVEKYLKRVLLLSTIEIKVPYLNRSKGINGVYGTRAIHAPSPCMSILTIHSVTDGGEPVVVDATNFEIDSYTFPNCIKPVYGQEWPEADYFLIRMECGEEGANLDDQIKLAILILAADAYENRTTQVRDRDNNVKMLLKPLRINEFIDYTNTSEYWPIQSL